MSRKLERLRDEICRVGEKLARRGLAPGTSGNISVRLDDGWLMTPTNASLGELDPGRLTRLDTEGRVLSGDPPTKESFLHRAIYDVRPRDGAVVHLHSTHAVAVSCLAHPHHPPHDPALPPDAAHRFDSVLPAITPYFVMRVGSLPLVPYFRPGDRKLAEAIRDYAAGHRAVLLANHGPIVAGTSLSAATAAIEELEETAKLHLLLRGSPVRSLTGAQIRDLEDTFRS